MAAKSRLQGLLVVMLIPIALAIWTLMPGSASKVNDLGYVSACPFAPWSTLSLLLLAGVIWVIRQYFITRPPEAPSL